MSAVNRQDRINTKISDEEEIERVVPVIEKIKANF